MLVHEDHDCRVDVWVGSKRFLDSALVRQGRIGRANQRYLAERERRIEQTEEFCEAALVLRLWRREAIAETVEEFFGRSLRRVRKHDEDCGRAFRERVFA